MKLSAARIKRLLDLIAAGHTVKAACVACNITKVTYFEWTRQGRTDADNGVDSLQRQLYDGVPDAEALHEQTHLDNIIQASKKTWQASAWYLERRYPERYSKRNVKPEQEPNDKIIVIG